MKKTKFNKLIAIGCLLTGVGLTACEDWLTIYPNSQIVEENFWEDKNDLQSVRYSAYRNMVSGSSLERYFYWGEIRADYYKAHPVNFSQTVTDLLKADLDPKNGNYTSWEIFYNTINFCNKVLEHGEDIKAKDASFTDTEWLPIQAEMYALRALNYFYLIRAFGDVPYVTRSINDDTQVTNHPAMSQTAILDDCLLQMENTVGNAVYNYGKWTDNKAFMTKNAIYALMADMYLWRASVEQGRGETEKALADYARCNECCKTVIDKVREQTEEYNKEDGFSGTSINGSPGTSTNEEDPYSFLIQNSTSRMSFSSTTSGAYNRIFGSGNSTESIFELQCLAGSNPNTLSKTFLYGGDALLQAANKFVSPSTDPDDEANLYAKTDMRKLETADCSSDNKNLYFIRKWACTSITHSDADIKDNTTKDDAEFEADADKGNSSNWIVYRVTDIMLMKAEALNQMGLENKDEVFALVEAVYKRSNPYPYSKNEKNSMLNAGKYSSQESLEKLVLRERQRELVAEGKRWFDLVRFALRRATVDDTTPTEFLTVLTRGMESETANVLKKKLVSMKALYLPLNETEVKTNTLLTQNPAWNKNQDISKN
ncbi:MAG: RagB/SusD family nutrient uptake outer membrane protein [Paraprevotella sp.]|nr:RagB/SusD family nutrient uptake outer membrane protein [Paraprevotella sp.]